MPEVVVPDNQKSAVVRAAFGGGATALNRSYHELTRHQSTHRRSRVTPRNQIRFRDTIDDERGFDQPSEC